MAKLRRSRDPDPRTLAELSALADGTLDPRREPAIRELIASSPELSQLYERERQAVAALHTLRADRAPAQVRLAASRSRGSKRPAWQRPPALPRARLIYGGGLAAAVAAVVAVLTLVAPGGAPGAPAVSQAADLALRGPALPPPPANRLHPESRLGQDVQEIYFPNWSGWFGWRAVGQRIDRFARRQAVTVYYARAGRQIAYTILAAPALPWPGTRTKQVGATKLQSFQTRGRLVVTWRRDGHTCVLSGAGVSVAELSKLAAWDASGTSA